MLLVLTVTLAVIIRFTFVLKENVMHNRCHTDSINIEELKKTGWKPEVPIEIGLERCFKRRLR